MARSTASPGQLDAGLLAAHPTVTPVPATESTGLAGLASLRTLSIAPEWKGQQRLWGHAFHPMCSYLAMFPAALAHAFIARYSRPGDVVLDPFSGRGTTPLQACAEGRVGVGNDLNPLAAILTAAKVDPPTRLEATARIAGLRIRWSLESAEWEALARKAVDTPGPDGIAVPAAGGDGPAAPLPPEVALCFHPRTLGQLLMVREALQLGERTDRFLAAAMTGILHGKSQAYLSDIMPNSFSMAPRYVRDFVARTDHRPPHRDVFVALDGKLRRLYRQGSPSMRGLGLIGDARDAGHRARLALGARSLPDRARLVVTSPPYLRVVKYGYYNWLRMWFLGVDPGQVDAVLDDGHKLPEWLAFLRTVMGNLREALTDDAVVVLVVGDVALDRGRAITHGTGLAETVWREALAPEGYLVAGLVQDDILAHRKMTKIWGAEAGRATTVDRILVVAPTEIGRRRALSGAMTPIGWDWPMPDLARSFRIAELPARKPAPRTSPARPGRVPVTTGDAAPSAVGAERQAG